MRSKKDVLKAIFSKTVFASFALGAFLLLGAPKAKTAGWDDHRPVQRYSYYGPQPGQWRHERREAYGRADRYRQRREWRERDWRGFGDRDRYYRHF